MEKLPDKFVYYVKVEGDYHVPVTVEKQPSGAWLEKADDGNEVQFKKFISKQTAKVLWKDAQLAELIERGGFPLTEFDTMEPDKRKITFGAQYNTAAKDRKPKADAPKKQKAPQGNELPRSPGEPIRKGLGKAAGVAGKTMGALGPIEPGVAATDRTQKILEWARSTGNPNLARWEDMLNKGLLKDVEKELPAGWASKQPKTGSGSAKPKKETPVETPPEKKPKKEPAQKKPQPKPEAEAKPKPDATQPKAEVKPTETKAKTKPAETKSEAEPKPKADAPKKQKAPKGKVNVFGYEEFTDKARALEKAKANKSSGGVIQRIRQAYNELPTVPGEPMRKGLGKAAGVAGKTMGALGLLEPGAAALDAYKKDFKDSEANRKARRAAAVFAGQAIGSTTGGSIGGTVTSKSIVGIPIGVATGAAAGGYAGGELAGGIYDRFDPPPVVEKLETKKQQPPEGRDWQPGELDKLFDSQSEDELQQMQQERIDQVPEATEQDQEQIEAATAAETSGAARGPYYNPTLNRDPDLENILNPPDPDDSFNRLLRMQDNARNNSAILARKKRIMQAGLEMAETGTFRVRRPDRYTIVV